MTLFATLFRRLGQSWRWLLAQLALTPLLIVLAMVWTRLPERNFLWVAATFLLPLLVMVSFLELEAGTMRALIPQDGQRVRLVWGAIWLLAASLPLWIGWGLCNDFASNCIAWASYLNSQSPAHTRLLTFDRSIRALLICGWALRWILLPVVLLPLATSVTQWGQRIPWRRVLRLFAAWKWWAGVIVASWMGVWLPSHFFNAPPHGTVHAQEWHLGLKLGGAFLLKLASWILLLGWLGVQWERIPATPRSPVAESFCRNLRAAWKPFVVAVGIILALNLPLWPLSATGSADTVAKLALGIRVAACTVLFGLLVVAYRAMFPHAQRTKIHWGLLACLVWLGITFGVASLDEKFPLPVLHWPWGDWISFVVFAPFAAAAAVRGWRLPWMRLLKLLGDPRWFGAATAAFLAVTCLTDPIANQFAALAQSGAQPALLHDFIAMPLNLGVVVLEIAWLAALLAAGTVPEEQPAPVATKTPQPDADNRLDLPD